MSWQGSGRHIDAVKGRQKRLAVSESAVPFPTYDTNSRSTLPSFFSHEKTGIRACDLFRGQKSHSKRQGRQGKAGWANVRYRQVFDAGIVQRFQTQAFAKASPGLGEEEAQ